MPSSTEKAEKAAKGPSAQSHNDSQAHDTTRQVQDPLDDAPIEDVPPPPYNSTDYGQLDISHNGLSTGAKVGPDGRVNIKIDESNRKLTGLLVPALRRQLEMHRHAAPSKPSIPPGLGEVEGLPPPPMNIVIQIVGSRGDVQPFVALGQVLKQKYNHRVRIATHPTFRDFINENGLEFFSIGGDPSELMAFMVKNPGLMPGFDSLKNGDIGKRRKTIYEIITGCWRSCIEAGDGTGIRASDDQVEGRSFDSGISVSDPNVKPFVADAIIANPPSFAHVHIAEKMGIPLHLMFTMPWSPTQSFPHPLANIIKSNTDPTLANFISYALVDMLTWQGLGDIINRFREKTLGLEPVSIMWAPGMASRLRIPYTYCWSPALIPKPADWGDYIDISGFFFLNLASNYTPAPDLAEFLEAGEPPVYIGFGSIVVDDPNAMTKLIFEAVKKTGRRALVSKGWGGLGADQLGIPDGVFMLGNCPHDWLFKQVACVVHHGGAGTTAAGIAAGRPTVVVPFFGDQPFWGSMTARAGAGPPPIPYAQLTADKLADAIKEALKPESLQRAKVLSERISQEKGTEIGAESFHKQLHLPDLRCSLCPERVAVWRVKRTNVRLSALAAIVLGNEGLLDFTDLKLNRPCEYETEDGPFEPISGGAASIIGTFSNFTMSIADFPVEIVKSMKSASNDAREKRKNEDESRSSGTLSPATESKESIVRSPDQSSIPTSISSKEAPTIIAPEDKPADEVAGSAIGDGQPSKASSLTDTASSPSSTKNNSSQQDLSKQQSSDKTSHHPTAMSTALSPDGHSRHNSWSKSRSSSGSRSHTPTRSRDRSCHSRGEEVGQISLETALGGAKAMGRIVSVGMKSPMDFTMSIAKGFHNAPRLYGDETVRRNEKITGLHSGLRVAGKEFGYGLYDGITGLVTQPLAGARKEGAAGFVKGAAKGIGGLILKPGAGFWGLPGYTFKGIYAEVSKHFGRSVQNYIIAARTAQGYEDWKQSSPEERVRIVELWKSNNFELKKRKSRWHTGNTEHAQSPLSPSVSNPTSPMITPTTSASSEPHRRPRDMPVDGATMLVGDKQQQKKRWNDLKFGKTKADPGQSSTALENDLQSPAIDDDFEQAIQRSVAATSRGDPHEDAMVERALRASVRELHRPTSRDDDALSRAIQASVNEARSVRSQQGQTTGVVDVSSGEVGDDNHNSPEEDDHLRRALTESLDEYKLHQIAGNVQDHPAELHDHWHDSDSGFGTEDDENFKKVMEESKRMHTERQSLQRQETGDPSSYHPGQADVDDEEQLRLALKESEHENRAREEEIHRQRTEEDIVMEYVKKQSILEEELRQKRDGDGTT